LAAAREKRRAAKELLAQGIDPGAVAVADTPAGEETVPTNASVAPDSFEAVARAWHANREEALDAAHAGRVLRRLERDAFPDLGRKPITEITAPEILAVIRKVEARGALDVGRRLKQSISQAFRFAIASGWATIDPTVHLTGALKPRPRQAYAKSAA
jgi:integrase